MSGICSAHQHHEAGCRQCEALTDVDQLCVHPWEHIGVSAEGRPFCSQCCVNLVKDPPWRDASPVNPFDKARAVFAGKKGDGFLLKCWFDSQEDLDAAFEALEGLPSTTEGAR